MTSTTDPAASADVPVKRRRNRAAREREILEAAERRDRAARLGAWVLREKTLEPNLHRWPDAWRELVAHAHR